ncbi:hypothetical protein [Streptomyces canus]|uniref:hypothetical protein n=1 Tax=Streptomyces canus TaxID=58343 RepID=UPI0036ED2AF8
MNDHSPHPGVRARSQTARYATALAGAATALLLTVAAPGLARADEEESTQSAVLVEQAIALIANDAGDARVAERIDDALAAPQKQGVDLALARQALGLIERPGDSVAATRQARTLLLDSLGGKLPSAPRAGRPATGTETGTSTVLDEFKPARGISDGGDAVLLAVAVAAIGGGLWLARRLRPPHTLRELEHRTTRKEGR